MPPKTLSNTPIPVFDRMVDDSGMITLPWRDYFLRMPLTLQLSIERINAIEDNGLSAALPATDFSGGGLTEGLYRASYYCQLEQAASGTSSFQVTLSWTHEGTVTSRAGTVRTGNVLTTFDQATIMIHCDADSAVNIEISYASAGLPDSMIYHYHAVLERMVVS